MQVEEYSFDQNGKDLVSMNAKGNNWPVVYLISNDNDLYIGETTSAANRIDQHLKDPQKERYNLKTIRIVYDDKYNKSVVLDYEQRLIKCCKTDAKYNVINRNLGQSSSHEYYLRKEHSKKFENLWEELKKVGLANDALDELENRAIFKFSPYNSLTEEQNAVSVAIINDICEKLEKSSSQKGSPKGISLVNGCAGTGKTVLAISIINSLVNAQFMDYTNLTEDEMNTDKVKALRRLKKWVESSSGHQLKIGFVFPMTGIRKTIRSVFHKCGNGLSAKMVFGPYDLRKDTFDVLFVDESHRLCGRKNITSYKSYDNVCKALGFKKDTATQLDWVIKQGQYNVLFYDEDQSIKGSDITYQQYQDTINDSCKSITRFQLNTQMRCEGGAAFISYIKNIIGGNQSNFEEIVNYDFRMFDDVDEMVKKIQAHNKKYGLCRTVAGYSWRWNTKPRNARNDMDAYNNIVESGEYDIDIKGNHYIWNLTTEDWISRKDSEYTIGCIHTIQGFDLNYVGVIFGEEIYYDINCNRIMIDLSKFCDTKVKAGCPDDVVKRFIINAYTTMMSRGIKGCYVYACDDNLQSYFKKYIRSWKDNSLL